MQERELPLRRDQLLGERDHVAIRLIVEDAGENACDPVVEHVRRVQAGVVTSRHPFCVIERGARPNHANA